MPLALYIVSIAESFEDAVRLAVVYGGDTDTVGAIVGSLAEARFGIPDDIAVTAITYLPVEMQDIVNRFYKRMTREKS